MDITIKTDKIHRRYPESRWDYQAISTLVENGSTNLIYYTVQDNNVFKLGVEVYKGPNYISGATGSNYSRNYGLETLPKKYKDTVTKLAIVHSKTVWSKEERVEEN